MLYTTARIERLQIIADENQAQRDGCRLRARFESIGGSVARSAKWQSLAAHKAKRLAKFRALIAAEYDRHGIVDDV